MATIIATYLLPLFIVEGLQNFIRVVEFLVQFAFMLALVWLFRRVLPRTPRRAPPRAPPRSQPLPPLAAHATALAHTALQRQASLLFTSPEAARR